MLKDIESGHPSISVGYDSGVPSLPRLTLSSDLSQAPTMFSSSGRSKQRDVTLSALDGVIQVLTVAKDGCGVPPAQIALGSACVLLTTIKVRFL